MRIFHRDVERETPAAGTAHYYCVGQAEFLLLWHCFGRTGREQDHVDNVGSRLLRERLEPLEGVESWPADSRSQAGRRRSGLHYHTVLVQPYHL